MSKDILERARQEANSEYEDSVYNDILKKSVVFLGIMCAALWIIRGVHADIYSLKIVTASESIIIFSGFASFVSLMSYGKLKEKKNLYLGLIQGMFAVGFFINFLLSLFG